MVKGSIVKSEAESCSERLDLLSPPGAMSLTQGLFYNG